MHVSIRHVAGIASADIPIDHGITLLAGLNFAGKSTALKMTAAALCGVAIPTSAIKKKDAKAMVRRGAKTGKVEIADEQGSIGVIYPACDVASNGRPPSASPFAVGRSDLSDLDDRERARFLVELLKTDPTRDDLVAALRDAGIPADRLDQTAATAWSLQEQHGWDGAAKLAQENGAKLKGRWEQITGEGWGADKAAHWQPADTAQAIFTTPRDVLERAVVEARATVDGLVGASAVSTAEREALVAQAATLEAAQAAHRDSKVQASALALDAAQTARAALPPHDMRHAVACPHCAKLVAISADHHGGPGAYRLAAVEQIDAAEARKRLSAIASADGLVGRLQVEYADANKAFMAASAALTAAENATKKLAALPAPGAEDDHGAVLTARVALTRAEEDLKSFDAHLQAAEVSGQIARTLIVIDVLRADGLRQTKLGDVLDSFNGGVLADLTAAAGWKTVAVAPDMTVTYAGRPLVEPLCSESEIWRAKVVLRLAIAKLQRAPLVIVDRADILDQDGRNGLFGLLAKAWSEDHILSLVAMTIVPPTGSRVDPRTLVPDLAAHNLGTTWWLDAGVTSPLGSTAAQAA